MNFDKASSDFQCLLILGERMEQDPKNAGWYLHRAYMLGEGCSVDEALEFPPADRSVLTLVKP
jgi:hypothetical protein